MLAWVATGNRTQGLPTLAVDALTTSYDYPAATQHSLSVFKVEKQATSPMMKGRPEYRMAGNFTGAIFANIL